MTALDFIICGIYLALTAGIGLYVGFKRKYSDDSEYYLAGRRVGIFAIGISVMATAFSAINYLAIPTEIAEHGLYVILAFPVFLLVTIPVAYSVIPFFCRQRQTSAYEFLEQRFGLKVRLLAGGLYIFWQLSLMALILVASSRILFLLSGVPVPWLIAILGLTAGGCAVIGGLKAVIWTDVLQFFVIAGSIALVLIVTANGSDSGIIAGGLELGKLKPFLPFDSQVLSPDPSVRMTLWSVFTGTFVMFMARYGADQSVIQRYAAAGSIAKARKMFIWNISAALFCLIMLAMFGLALAHFAHLNGMAGKPGLLVMVKLLHRLPNGVNGLVVAGILAAAMSSLDSGVNSIGVTWQRDFQHRLISVRGNTILHKMLESTVFTIISILLALVILVCFKKHSIFVMTARTINALGSPLLVVVGAGMLPVRLRPVWSGVFWGGLGGIFFSIIFCLSVDKLAVHYYAAVNFVATAAMVIIVHFWCKLRLWVKGR
ncbi:hypothetical protein P0136_08820 [Lentisphaerota bacterium ZTH]|nr:hypothetical protein JYG24_00075 [Lentisphaerota bacterium]WET05466.1 hypothetical protein P0136_08820 [Lentisphaerota bacterium ZTH]